MLRNNEMDAMLLTEPQATTARLLNNPVLLDSRDLKENLGAFAFRTKIYRDKRRREQYRKFVKAYNMGANDFITKPIILEKLIESVSNQLKIKDLARR